MTLPNAIEILSWPSYEERIRYLKSYGFQYNEQDDAWNTHIGETLVTVRDDQLRDAPVPKIGAAWPGLDKQLTE